jgi:hypothetical protein
MEGRVAETKWYWYLWLVSLVTTLGSARETSFYVQSERIGKNWRQRKKGEGNGGLLHLEDCLRRQVATDGQLECGTL